MPTLMGKINIISRCARLYRNDRLKAYGIRGTNDAIILQVCKNPGISQDEIAAKICIDKSNVARKIARLEADGYLKRAPDSRDRRIQRVFPEEKALSVYTEIRAILSDWNDYVTEGMSEDDLKNAMLLLDTIYERSREYAIRRDGEAE